ncbi:MAG: heme A synthase, partial [Gammaproteobacteria bacterium]|nr:heme A synthase [Gammaproteobacteria bacterium]
MTTIDNSTLRNRRQIGIWLLICCALIFAMVVLGGVTRLTGSGLSMVEWKPVYGVLPPMNQTDWEDLYEKYNKTPEAQKINIGMDLEGFKGIFWLEYLHRILGRLIGVVFLLPFLFFLLMRRVDKPLMPKLVTMFVLGGLQGGLGWLMVKSGLVDNPHVSQYRLTAHLMLAVLIYGYILWVALGLLAAGTVTRTINSLGNLKLLTYCFLGLVALTLTSGGFVAGLKAGLAYNTFPLMDGRWVPEGLFNLQPWPMNLFANMATVQFNH